MVPASFPDWMGQSSRLCHRWGATNMSMKNQGGVTIVILKNSGQESGTQLSLGPGGMQIQDEVVDLVLPVCDEGNIHHRDALVEKPLS